MAKGFLYNLKMNKKTALRLFAFAFALMFSLSALSGCNFGDDMSGASDDGGISVVASTFPVYDTVKRVVPENVRVTLLLSPGAEPHDYEPTPSDIRKVGECDLFVYVGGESDAWADTLLGSFDGEVSCLTLMDCVEKLEEETVEGAEPHEDHDGSETAYDEHIWTSPANVVLMAQSIAGALSEIDGAGEAEYRANAAAYAAELEELDGEFKAAVSRLGIKTLLFGDRFPFLYFTKHYGLNYYAAFAGCSHDTEPSLKTMTFLTDRIREENIQVVFYTELSNHSVADTLAAETGASTAMLHSCSNVTAAEFENGETYLSLMRKNLKTLEEAFSGAADQL